jgi:hypothetical protein
MHCPALVWYMSRCMAAHERSVWSLEVHLWFSLNFEPKADNQLLTDWRYSTVSFGLVFEFRTKNTMVGGYNYVGMLQSAIHDQVQSGKWNIKLVNTLKYHARKSSGCFGTTGRFEWPITWMTALTSLEMAVAVTTYSSVTIRQRIQLTPTCKKVHQWLAASAVSQEDNILRVWKAG